jgi:hypothetical protein
MNLELTDFSFMPGDTKPKASGAKTHFTQTVALLLAIALVIFATWLLHYEVVSPFLDHAHAAYETPQEICQHLDHYSNGATFADYCNSI